MANTKGHKYQKAVEYLYNVGMSVQFRILGSEDAGWVTTKNPSFLWERVEYRIKPADLKHEKKFAKMIRRVS